jgi:hypothetical protein
MPQPKKKEDKPTVSQVLKLVHQLSPEEQEQLAEQMKLEWLKRAVQIGIDELDRGEYVDGEELLEELRISAESQLKKSQP